MVLSWETTSVQKMNVKACEVLKTRPCVFLVTTDADGLVLFHGVIFVLQLWGSDKTKGADSTQRRALTFTRGWTKMTKTFKWVTKEWQWTVTSSSVMVPRSFVSYFVFCFHTTKSRETWEYEGLNFLSVWKRLFKMRSEFLTFPNRHLFCIIKSSDMSSLFLFKK